MTKPTCKSSDLSKRVLLRMQKRSLKWKCNISGSQYERLLALMTQIYKIKCRMKESRKQNEIICI